MILAFESEAGHICAAWHFGLPYQHHIGPFRDHLPQVFLGIDSSAVLVNIGNLYRLANLETARAWLLEPDDAFEQRRFANPIGADNADDAISRQVKGEILDKNALAERFAEILCNNNLRAKPRTRRNMYIGEVDLLHCARRGIHLLIALQTRFAFCLARFRARSYPFEFSLEFLGQLRFLLPLGSQTCRLRLEIRRIVAFIRVEMTAVDFANPPGNVIEKIPVMRYREHSSLVFLEELLEPEHRFGI